MKRPSDAGIVTDEPRGRTLGTLLKYLSLLIEGRLRRMVTRALALTPRGFVPDDVLILNELSARLRLEWRTRDLHPWDRDLPESRRAERFRDQTLSDTDAAIERLFRILPEMDVIAIRVREPRAPNRLILAGTVTREDLVATRALSSPGMRLKMMGVISCPTTAEQHGTADREQRVDDGPR
jgi:hypothetical protein